MKKTFFLPVTFIIWLIVSDCVLALLFELYFLTQASVLFSFEQFIGLCLQFFPLSILIASFLSFTYALKKDCHYLLSALLLTLMFFISTVLFYLLFSKGKEQKFILDGFEFSHIRLKAILLEDFFAHASVFFTDWIKISQSDLNVFLIFSSSLCLLFMSFFFISFTATRWKLLNLIIMLTLCLLTVYSYPFFASEKMHVIFNGRSLSYAKEISLSIIFCLLSFFVFLFLMITLAIKKSLEKRRSEF